MYSVQDRANWDVCIQVLEGRRLVRVVGKVKLSCRAELELERKNWLINLHAILIMPSEMRETEPCNEIGNLRTDSQGCLERYRIFGWRSNQTRQRTLKPIVALLASPAIDVCLCIP